MSAQPQAEAPKKHVFEPNQKVLEELKKNAAAVKAGGMRRKKVATVKHTVAEDTKVLTHLKRFGLVPVNDVTEVNFVFPGKDKCLHFSKPHVHTVTGQSMFVIAGKNEMKVVPDAMEPLFPYSEIFSQLSPQSLAQLTKLSQMAAAKKEGEAPAAEKKEEEKKPEEKKDIPDVKTFEDVQ